MEQKVILITGGSSGMGMAAARLLAQAGHRVYVAARRVEKMQALAPLGVTPLAMDITRPEDTSRVVDHILAEAGRIDVLINNAGIGWFGPVEEAGLDKARQQFEVNLFGLAELTAKVIPHMRAQGSGRIVNVTSMAGKLYLAFGAWYYASKHALEGWSDCLRLELAPHGIKVVIVEPGVIDTDWWDGANGGLADHAQSPAYGKRAQRMIAAFKSGGSSVSTSPEVLARTFVRAATAPRPRRRYAKGQGAKPLIFIRRFLGDAVFERIIRLFTA